MNVVTKKPAPDDFATVCMNLSSGALRTHYRAGASSVCRWLKTLTPEQAEQRSLVVTSITRAALTEKGKLQTLGQTRPMPDDFAELAPTMFKAELEDHYRTSHKIVSRWLSQLPGGVACKRRETQMTTEQRARRARSFRKVMSAPSQSTFASEANRSTAQLAALHLQRRFAPVCSATIVDPTAKGQWIVGRRTMPEADMLAFAERQGWRRDAWQDLRV